MQFKKNQCCVEVFTQTLFWFYKAHCQNGFNEAIKIGHISSTKNIAENK